jgi:hypothetical protein
VVEESSSELLDDLLAPIPRKAVVPAFEAALGLSRRHADTIVQAFDDYVARPLEANLKKLYGRDLARRNPFIYTVRGIETVDEWSERVLADKETSAIESHIGTFLEQVARIVSGGISSPAMASTSSSKTRTASCIFSRSKQRRTRRTPAAVALTSRP